MEIRLLEGIRCESVQSTNRMAGHKYNDTYTELNR